MKGTDSLIHIQAEKSSAGQPGNAANPARDIPATKPEKQVKTEKW